jgi:hypothetical protein
MLVGCAAGRKAAPAAVPRPVHTFPVVAAAPPDAGTSRHEPLTPPEAPPAANDPAAAMQMKEVTEKEWLASTRKRLGDKLEVDGSELRFSPSKRLVACVRQIGGPRPAPPPTAEAKPGHHAAPPAAEAKPGHHAAPHKPPRHPPPRRWQIVVVDPEGGRRGLFRPVTAKGSDEPPKDFRFLTEDRLVYEVVQPPPPPAPAPKKKKPTGHHGKPPAPTPTTPPLATEPALPERLFVIQPVERRPRAIRCQGVRFASAPTHDHLAFVAGRPDSSFVSVDGVQVYPRKGRTVVATDLAWSKDGRSLAFVENPPAKPRLVLLAEVDNPTGDTTWDLPPAAPLDGARVVWSGPGKLVVARAATRPLFTASFVKEKPAGAAPERFKNAGP